MMNIVQLHTRYRHAGGEDGVVDAEAEVLRSRRSQGRPGPLRQPDGTAAGGATP